jgi:hypothetical protein
MKVITPDRIEGQQVIGKSCKAIIGDNTRSTQKFVSPQARLSIFPSESASRPVIGKIGEANLARRLSSQSSI